MRSLLVLWHKSKDNDLETKRNHAINHDVASCYEIGRVGIEPTTLGLKGPCSTAELPARVKLAAQPPRFNAPRPPRLRVKTPSAPSYSALSALAGGIRVAARAGTAHATATTATNTAATAASVSGSPGRTS